MYDIPFDGTEFPFQGQTTIPISGTPHHGRQRYTQGELNCYFTMRGE